MASWKSGDATNIPACAVAGRPVSTAVPIAVQCRPSADSYPVMESPDLVRRSQDADTALPATSWVKSYCIRTPWSPVSMTAA